MDREHSFAEYARILKDTADWISFGYRMDSEDDIEEIKLPESGMTGTTGDERSELVQEGSLPTGKASAENKQLSAVSENSFDASSSSGGLQPQTIRKSGPDFPSSDNSAGISFRSDSQAAASIRVQSDMALKSGGHTPDSAPSDRAVFETPWPKELRAVADKIAQCRSCNLYLTRESTVPGVGPVGATLMIVTPPPVDGACQGDSPLPPYEAEYLEKWLVALELDLTRDIFLSPAVKCRTPGGRPPHAEEAAACSGYLREQYKVVRPKAVLALGDAACGVLTGSASDFPTLVGKDWTWGSVPALVLWTPAEVLANPSRLRRPVWEALQRLKVAWNAVGTGF